MSKWKYCIISLAFLTILVTLVPGCNEDMDWLDISTNNSTNETIENPFKDMASKKVIIRNDDIWGEVDLALEWISNLTVSKNIKITYAVIPSRVIESPELIDYLNNLPTKTFEMATHGYTHNDANEYMESMSYQEQYSVIQNGTVIMEDCFGVRPYSFVAPFGSEDFNTVLVLKALGYHSRSGLESSGLNMTNFADVDFTWENSTGHNDYEYFRTKFDQFYMLNEEFYLVVLHYKTFFDESGKPNETLINEFERSIDYMIDENVQFMTIEEAYQWYVDKDNISWGKINDSCFFIDLTTCQYDHMIKFNSPEGWEGNILVTDITTNEEIDTYIADFEFVGTKGHYYVINERSAPPP